MLEKHEEVLYGDDQEIGLLEWFEEKIEDYYKLKKDVKVFSNSLIDEDELRKGDFPSVQIYPGEDGFERKNERLMIHELTISLAVSTKGPQEDAFRESSMMAEELYSYFKNVVPRIGPVKDPPFEGEINYSWEGFRTKGHGNQMMAHSKIDLKYRFRC